MQLAGHDMLKSLGISIIPASAPDFFTEDTPTAVLVRQVLGAISQFEKASAVAKLAAARKRKREREGRCEGRKPLSETKPEVVALARKLRRRKPKRGQLSLRVSQVIIRPWSGPPAADGGRAGELGVPLTGEPDRWRRARELLINWTAPMLPCASARLSTSSTDPTASPELVWSSVGP